VQRFGDDPLRAAAVRASRRGPAVGTTPAQLDASTRSRATTKEHPMISGESAPVDAAHAMMNDAASELWCALLCGRLDQVRASLPRGLQGVVEIVVARGGDPLVFCLGVNGPSSAWWTGPALEPPEVRVSTTRAALERVLFDPDPIAGPPAFTVEGDVALLRDLLAALVRLPSAM
jgi:hypothetical protein